MSYNDPFLRYAGPALDTGLWDSISRFDIDSPISEYGFSTRLAKENIWTKQFTDSAILEYKKFMYLAATSDLMVSPSGIVDTVWHQHLIFTQSYTDLCNILGKQVQHIPSTHNKKEYEKFRLAKERTTKRYQEVFGDQPKDIWDYDNMYDSLELPKARLKIRGVVLLGILLFIAALIPSYRLLRPVYVQIDNPDFLVIYIAVTVLAFVALHVFNKNYLSKTLKRFQSYSFIFKLHSSELLYLKSQKLADIVHGTVSGLVDKKAIVVRAGNTLEINSDVIAETPEEHLVLDSLETSGVTTYPELLKLLVTKPLFMNVESSMKALKKFYVKSRSFAFLFYINFITLMLLLMGGMVRLFTGLLRDKPVILIVMVLFLLTAVILGTLWELTSTFTKNTLPDHYKKEILPAAPYSNNFEWQFFLLGTAALSASFIPIVKQYDKTTGEAYSYSDSSSSDSSCSSSGSSCSSCGGCGGGGD